MRIKNLIPFLGCLLLPTLSHGNSRSDYDYYYINGMFTPSVPNAESNRLAIESTIRSALNDDSVNVKLLYNQDHEMLKQLLDVFIERSGDIDDLDKFQPNFITEDFWAMYYRQTPESATFLNAIRYFSYTLRDKEVGPYSQKDLDRMIETVRSSLSDKKKIVIIPHSQGNFFYKNLYAALKASNKELTNNCTQAIGLASPLGNIHGNYDWINNSNDLIINAVRYIYPDTLAPNTTIPKEFSELNGDKLGHGIRESYLSHQDTINKFKHLLNDARSALQSECSSKQTPLVGYLIASTTSRTAHSYDISINNKHIGSTSRKEFEATCHTQLFLPTKLKGTNKSDLRYASDNGYTPSISQFLPSACLRVFEHDSSGKITFTDNLPNLDNVETQHSAVFTRTIPPTTSDYDSYTLAVQPIKACKTKNGEVAIGGFNPSRDGAWLSGTESSYLRKDFSLPSYSLAECDWANEALPTEDSRVEVSVTTTGDGICLAEAYIDGNYKGIITATHDSSYTWYLTPYGHEVKLSNFSGCGGSTSPSNVVLKLFHEGKLLTDVDYYQPRSTFYIAPP